MKMTCQECGRETEMEDTAAKCISAYFCTADCLLSALQRLRPNASIVDLLDTKRTLH